MQPQVNPWTGGAAECAAVADTAHAAIAAALASMPEAERARMAGACARRYADLAGAAGSL